MMIRHDLLDPSALSVHISELLVATAESSDPGIDRAVTTVLRLLREQLRMDVVVGLLGVRRRPARVFRFVDSAPDALTVPVGGADPLEESYLASAWSTAAWPNSCKDAATVPSTCRPRRFPVGAHLSTPIRLPDGSVYGARCAA